MFNNLSGKFILTARRVVAGFFFLLYPVILGSIPFTGIYHADFVMAGFILLVAGIVYLSHRRGDYRAVNEYGNLSEPTFNFKNQFLEGVNWV